MLQLRQSPRLRAAARVVGVARWLDADDATHPRAEDRPAREQTVEWVRILPFLAMHAMCLGVLAVGWSWTAVWVCAGLYLVRMFAVTAGYHRYFSHRSFKTSRLGQLCLAVLGNAAGQRGPLWWAAQHRKHHLHSDTDRDVHSPRERGLWWSHVGWFTTRESYRTDHEQVRDLARFPELRFLDRFDTLVPMLLLLGLFGAGELLAHLWPHLGTDGWQLLVWGFAVSTTVLFHATSLINSLAHRVGRRRYETEDTSRNSLLLALLTLGEGWHNNHHFYPVSTRQGFFWWQVDVTYYVLRALGWLGLVWDLRPVPAHVRAGARLAPRGEA